MSSGERFLKKTNNVYGQEITVNRQTLVDITAAWLYAARQIDEAKNITNIQFSEPYGRGAEEFVTLKVFTNGGATN